MAMQNCGFINLLLFTVLVFFAACNSDREPKFTDELPEDLATQWEDDRDEFAELTERQLEEWEEYLAQQRSEPEDADIMEEIEELEFRIDHARDRLTDLGDEDIFGWEEVRDEVADTLYSIQSDIEDRFGQPEEELQ